MSFDLNANLTPVAEFFEAHFERVSTVCVGAIAVCAVSLLAMRSHGDFNTLSTVLIRFAEVAGCVAATSLLGCVLPRMLVLVGWRVALSVAGVLTGSLLGFVLRPAAPFVGQVPFSTVIRRGTDLEGPARVLLPLAQESFNDMVLGALIGGIAAVVLTFASRNNRRN
jgi:hypothetical protein